MKENEITLQSFIEFIEERGYGSPDTLSEQDIEECLKDYIARNVVYVKYDWREHHPDERVRQKSSKTR